MSKLLFVLSFALLTLGACKTDADTTTPDVTTETGPVTQQDAAGNAMPGSADMMPIDAVTGYIDPVCQMKVSQDVTDRHTHEGVTYGFCSPGCKEKFVADPAPYLAALEE